MDFHFKYVTTSIWSIQELRAERKTKSLCRQMERIPLEENIGKSAAHTHTNSVALTENPTCSSFNRIGYSLGK